MSERCCSPPKCRRCEWCDAVGEGRGVWGVRLLKVLHYFDGLEYCPFCGTHLLPGGETEAMRGTGRPATDPYNGWDRGRADQEEPCAECGHPYRRHWNWGEAYRKGCKYCPCEAFVEPTDPEGGDAASVDGEGACKTCGGSRWSILPKLQKDASGLHAVSDGTPCPCAGRSE